jgi:16S rRNA processing protein RimM
MTERDQAARQPAEPGREIEPTDQFAGSPNHGEPVFLVVGKLRRPHGVHGEMLMHVLSDFPERIQPGVVLYLGSERHPIVLRSVRQHAHGLLVALEGWETPEELAEFRNQFVYVHAEDRPPLPEGEYYHHQIIGLRVIDEHQRLLGKIDKILENAANDVYVVRSEQGGEILLPAIDSVILDIDLVNGEMHVHLLPGLAPD